MILRCITGVLGLSVRLSIEGITPEVPGTIIADPLLRPGIDASLPSVELFKKLSTLNHQQLPTIKRSKRRHTASAR